MKSAALFSCFLSGTFITIVATLPSCSDEKPVEQASIGNSSEESMPLKDTSADNITMLSDHADFSAADTATIASIKHALTTDLLKDDLAGIPAGQRNFMFSKIDLNNDRRPEIFVGLTGNYFCGSGGCTAFLLDDKGKLITRFTVSAFPIIVRPDHTKGWRDLLVGTASKKPSLHLVKWNGKKYPGNPSLAPVFFEIPSEHSTRVLNCKDHAEHWFQF